MVSFWVVSVVDTQVPSQGITRYIMDFVTTALDSRILLDRDRLEFGCTVRMHAPASTAAVRWGFQRSLGLILGSLRGRWIL